MKKRLFWYCGLGVLLVAGLGTLNHFLYEWSGRNPLVGMFCPVNESTWEHMKLLFFPMAVYSLLMYFRLRREYPCIGSALCAGILSGTFLIPVIFYTYTGILGTHTLVLDILTFFLSVLGAFGISLKLAGSCKANSYGHFLRTSVAVLAVCFFLFTVRPPELALFLI